MPSTRSRFCRPCTSWIACAAILAPLLVVRAQATIHGTVFDSLSGRPLSGATVNLISPAAQTAAMVAISDSLGHFSFARVPQGDYIAGSRIESRSSLMVATSDSLGRFTFARLPRGAYIAGFFHPLLDSLGIEAQLRRVRVDSSNVSLSLAVPGRRTLREIICGRTADDDSAAVLVGEVRDAKSMKSVTGANVSANWLRFSMGNRRVVPREISLDVAADGNGRFAICGLPSEVDVQVQAALRSDSSGTVAMTIHPGGIAHRIIYLGGSTTRLHGRVRDAQTGQPLANARIFVVGSEATAASNGSAV